VRVSGEPALKTPLPLEERYRLLLGVSKVLGAIRDPEDLIRAVSRELQRILSFDHLSLFLIDVVGEGASWHIWHADDQSVLSPAGTVPLEETVEAWVVSSQRTFSWPGRGEQPVFPGLSEVLERHGVQSLCSIPLTTVNARVGAMSVVSRREGAYPGEEVQFLAVVADQIALAIDGAASFERFRVANGRLARSSERLKLVMDVGNRVLSNLDLQELLRSISANVRQVLRCDLASVVLIDPDLAHARLYVLDFPDSHGFAREGAVVPVERREMEEFLRIGQPREVGSDGISRGGTEFLRAEGLSSGFAFPLVSQGRPLGIFTVMRRTAEKFDRDEVDLVGQIASQVATALDNALAYREIAGLRDQLAREKLYLEDEIRSELSFDEIVGRSEVLRRVLKQVETVAPTESTVLISGETGTGKELIARAIHDRGSRSGRTFVKLSCAAIPTGLLESELFGHQKGAFTGAIADRVGRFELAGGGTVFLDEIGEVPLELQPKLLRVLQEREFERLGSSRTLMSDARLIAATNRDLAAMVEGGAFRADLFYRLNVFPIHVPALRERPEDIPLLVRHFVQQLGRRMNKVVETIPAETMSALACYDWPGNIRELQNLVERAMILTKGPVLRVPLDGLKPHGAPASGNSRRQTLKEAEREHVLSALEETHWVLGGANGAAARLGMNRSTLQFRLKKLEIVRPGR
jgi:formate hydrogenlyase transcriptional activator